MTSKKHLAYSIAVLAMACVVSAPARADFFDGARRTFQNDIPRFFTEDFPHFFQDDIPCAFGGQPTSKTKASCRAAPPAPVRTPDKPPPPVVEPPPAPRD